MSINDASTLLGHPGDIGLISDGHHTFNELYEHRHMLFMALIAEHPTQAWRSRLHQDGSMFDGWFIAGLNLLDMEITYHLPMRLWSLLDGILGEAKRAPYFDGHTSSDVVDRLQRFIELNKTPFHIDADSSEPSP